MYKKGLAGLLGICTVLMLAVLPFVSCICTPEDTSIHTYTVGMLNYPNTFNPLISDVGEADASHNALIYEPLIWAGADGSRTPGLAETWEYDVATMTWTIEIYEDAEWSDGQPVTATDVKYTLEQFDEMGHATMDTLGPLIVAITVVDSKTVTIELSEIYPRFVADIVDIVIVPEHVWGDMTVEEIQDYENDTDPIGSGPFTFREGEKDSHLIYDARPDYWSGQGDIDVVIKKYYATTEAQLLALKTGAIDACATLNMSTAVPQLLATDNVEIYQYQANTTMTWYVNHRTEPWNLKAFRKAVSIGIDRRSMVAYGADGWADMPNLIEVAPFVATAADGIEWPYTDLSQTQQERYDLANEALDDIPDMSAIVDGVRSYKGTPLAFTLDCTTGPNYLSCAERIALDCAEMGIAITVTSQSAKTLVGNVYRQTSTATEEGWETHLWSRPFDVEFDFIADNYAYNDPPLLNKRSWIIGWENSTIQDKFEQILTMNDGTARDAIIEEAQVLMAEEEPVICLYHVVTPNAYRTDVYKGQPEGAGYSMHGAVPGPMSPHWILALEPV